MRFFVISGTDPVNLVLFVPLQTSVCCVISMYQPLSTDKSDRCYPYNRVRLTQMNINDENSTFRFVCILTQFHAVSILCKLYRSDVIRYIYSCISDGAGGAQLWQVEEVGGPTLQGRQLRRRRHQEGDAQVDVVQ